MALSWVMLLLLIVAGVLGFGLLLAGVLIFLVVRGQRKPARGFDVMQQTPPGER